MGGGRFYYTEDPHHLPRIFTRETILAAKSAIIEEPFNARPVEGDSVIQGIDWGSAPQLLGYVATSPKPMANVGLVTHKDDPLFAHWQYGLGRSFAFTSDAKGRWARYWLLWPGYNKFWAQTVRWSLRRTSKSSFQLATEIDHGRGHITVDAVSPSGEFINYLRPTANVLSPGLGADHLRLQQIAPGRYEGWFDAREVGNYMVGVSYKSADGSASTQNGGIVISYPPEYKDLNPNRFLLTRLMELTAGRELDPDKSSEAFAGKPITARIPTDLWPALLLLTALLFPADVAVRRVMLDWVQVQQAWAGAHGRLTERTKLRAQKRREKQESLGRLLESKNRVVVKSTGSEAKEATEAARKLREALRAAGEQEENVAVEPTLVASPPEVHHPKPKEPEPDNANLSATERLLAAKRRAKRG